MRTVSILCRAIQTPMPSRYCGRPALRWSRQVALVEHSAVRVYIEIESPGAVPPHWSRIASTRPL
jgi:hypothetical protein